MILFTTLKIFKQFYRLKIENNIDISTKKKRLGLKFKNLALEPPCEILKRILKPQGIFGIRLC